MSPKGGKPIVVNRKNGFTQKGKPGKPKKARVYPLGLPKKPQY